jgi:mono/diheme cytochrome c family protein
MKSTRYAVALAALLLPLAGMAQTNARPPIDGQRAYMAAGCYQCHGTAGQGGVGPRLAPKPFPVDGLIAFVRGSSRSMPAYDAVVLPDAELRAIHAYLESIAPSPTPDQIPLLK